MTTRQCPRCGTQYSTPGATCRPCYYRQDRSSVPGHKRTLHDLECLGVRHERGKRFVGEHQGYLALARVVVTGMSARGMDPRSFFTGDELDLVRRAADAMYSMRGLVPDGRTTQDREGRYRYHPSPRV